MIPTLSTNNVTQFILPAKEVAWHGLTWMHASAGIAIAWLTHVNWARLGGAYRWLAQEGGLLGVFETIYDGQPTKPDKEPEKETK